MKTGNPDGAARRLVLTADDTKLTQTCEGCGAAQETMYNSNDPRSSVKMFYISQAFTGRHKGCDGIVIAEFRNTLLDAAIEDDPDIVEKLRELARREKSSKK